MKFNYFFFLLALAVFTVNCGDDEDVCETASLTYNNDIAAIINNNCATSGCHDSGTTTTFPLSNYDETNVAVGFGRMVGAISHTALYSPMPKGGDKLDQCLIDKVTQWIADGAPE